MNFYQNDQDYVCNSGKQECQYIFPTFFGMLHHIFIKYIYFLCRNQSLGGSQASAFVVSYDKLDPKEIKDLLICFLYIVKNLSEGEYTIYNFKITIFLSSTQGNYHCFPFTVFTVIKI